MLSRLCLVFLFVVQTNSLSVLIDYIIPTHDDFFIRQLLHQKTLIRMVLDRKDNDLVKSMTQMKNKMVNTNETRQKRDSNKQTTSRRQRRNWNQQPTTPRRQKRNWNQQPTSPRRQKRNWKQQPTTPRRQKTNCNHQQVQFLDLNWS